MLLNSNQEIWSLIVLMSQFSKDCYNKSENPHKYLIKKKLDSF